MFKAIVIAPVQNGFVVTLQSDNGAQQNFVATSVKEAMKLVQEALTIKPKAE